MTNTLNDFQIELIDNQNKLKEITQHNITGIADLTNEKKLIESALKEKDVNNRFLICGEYKMECINEINILVTSIKELKDVKKDKENIVTSNKQCIIFQKDLIQSTRKKIWKQYDSPTILMEKIFVLFGIDKARYHGGAMEVNSIQKLFQNANEIFK